MAKNIQLKKKITSDFFRRLLDWSDVEKKFLRPTNGILSAADQQEMLTLINNFEGQKVSELMDIIHRIEIPGMKFWKKNLREGET